MNPVEWLVYAAAWAYRSDPDHWLESAEPMCAAVDVIHLAEVARGQAKILGDYAHTFERLFTLELGDILSRMP